MPKTKKNEKKSVKKVATNSAKKKTAKRDMTEEKPVPIQIITSPQHRVECIKCNTITTIQHIGHNPMMRFMCIQCNAPLDIFNNCKTCNE